MKFCIRIFTLYFLMLCALPCTMTVTDYEHDACCTKDAFTHNYTSDGEPDKECAGCNPLASCHCTGIFTSFSGNFSFLTTPLSKQEQAKYLLVIPPTIATPIWQPPKIS